MEDNNADDDRTRRVLTTPDQDAEKLFTGGNRPDLEAAERGRSYSRHGSFRRERNRSPSRRISLRDDDSLIRYSRENRPSRPRNSCVDTYRRRRTRSRSENRINRVSRSHRGSERRSRSKSIRPRFDLYERLRLLEDEVRREREMRKRIIDEHNNHTRKRSFTPDFNRDTPKASSNPPLPKSDSPTRKQQKMDTSSNLFEEFVKIFKSRDRESFSSLNNVVPEFDPLSKEQTIDMWLSKVDECADIYNWSEKQTVHYALPKLIGHAKTWYQGLPSLKHTWPEWKILLKESFPSAENYAELLTEMLNRKARPGESLELYYFSKINLLNRCKIFGKQAVDCIVFGIEDKGIRLSAQAVKFEKPEEALEFFKTVKNQSRENTDLRRDTNFRDRRFSIQTSSMNTQRNDSRNRSRGSIVCFNCNDTGHPSFKCSKPVNKCSECNFLGHNAKDCPKKNNNTKSFEKHTNNK